MRQPGFMQMEPFDARLMGRLAQQSRTEPRRRFVAILPFFIGHQTAGAEYEATDRVLNRNAKRDVLAPVTLPQIGHHPGFVPNDASGMDQVKVCGQHVLKRGKGFVDLGHVAAQPRRNDPVHADDFLAATLFHS